MEYVLRYKEQRQKTCYYHLRETSEVKFKNLILEGLGPGKKMSRKEVAEDE